MRGTSAQSELSLFHSLVLKVNLPGEDLSYFAPRQHLAAPNAKAAKQGKLKQPLAVFAYRFKSYLQTITIEKAPR
jgi:hypothetical protein